MFILFISYGWVFIWVWVNSVVILLIGLFILNVVILLRIVFNIILEVLVIEVRNLFIDVMNSLIGLLIFYKMMFVEISVLISG